MKCYNEFFFVIGESSGASIDSIMAVYPRHKGGVDTFVNRGEVIGICPFADRGNMQYSEHGKQLKLLSKNIHLSRKAW